MNQANRPSSRRPTKQPFGEQVRGQSRLLHQVARQVAEGVLARHRVSSLPIHLYSITSQEGVEVVEEEHTPTHGALIQADQGYIILIDKNLSRYRKRFTIAHELGHLLLHRLRTDSLDAEGDLMSSLETVMWARLDEERFCDAFAGCLLVPQAAIVDFDDWKAVSISALIRAARQMKVSLKTFVRTVLDSAPGDGGALYFRIMGKPTDPSSVKLRLDSWYFPEGQHMYLPRYASLRMHSQLHAAASNELETYLPNGSIQVGTVQVRGSALVKRITQRGDAMALLIPPEADFLVHLRELIQPELPFSVDRREVSSSAGQD